MQPNTRLLDKGTGRGEEGTEVRYKTRHEEVRHTRSEFDEEGGGTAYNKSAAAAAAASSSKEGGV